MGKDLVNKEKNREREISAGIKAKETLVAILTTSSMREAASKLSIDESTLYMRVNKYNLREEIAKIPLAALDQLKQASYKASSVLIKNLDNPRKDMQAATEILDRAGVVKRDSIGESDNKIKRKLTVEEFFE